MSEPNPERRLLIDRIGVRTVDPSDDLAAVIEDWTEGAGVDVSFEVSGSAGGVEAAVTSLAARGRLVLVAIHSRPTPVDLFKFFWRELTLVGARVYERGDFEEALRLLSSGAIPTKELITDVVDLAEAATAFERLRAGKAMKVLVDCGAPN